MEPTCHPSRRSPGDHRFGAALALGLLVLTVPGLAAPARAQSETEVAVEKLRPQREKHPTLVFLKQNRDFIRYRFDQLRLKALQGRGDAGAIDPRYLAYSRMLAGILAAGDSIEVADDARQRQVLLASITELGGLEAQLDLMDRTLAEQRARLGILQEDFTGHQKTALIVVLSGDPGSAALDSFTLTLEDGARVDVAVTAEQHESLRQGGVLQVFHGFVEPREQVVEVAFGGAGWPAGDAGFVTLAPERDRITLLRLDLSRVRPAEGAASIRARTWLHDTRPDSRDG